MGGRIIDIVLSGTLENINITFAVSYLNQLPTSQNHTHFEKYMVNYGEKEIPYYQYIFTNYNRSLEDSSIEYQVIRRQQESILKDTLAEMGESAFFKDNLRATAEAMSSQPLRSEDNAETSQRPSYKSITPQELAEFLSKKSGLPIRDLEFQLGLFLPWKVFGKVLACQVFIALSHKARIIQL